MGLMAFDLDINEPVFAKNVIKKEKGRYICPSCASKGKNVPIYLSEKQTGNCFVSYDKSQHDDDCDFPIAYNAEYHNWNCQEKCSRRIPKILDRQISGSVMRELLGSS